MHILKVFIVWTIQFAFPIFEKKNILKSKIENGKLYWITNIFFSLISRMLLINYVIADL